MSKTPKIKEVTTENFNKFMDGEMTREELTASATEKNAVEDEARLYIGDDVNTPENKLMEESLNEKTLQAMKELREIEARQALKQIDAFLEQESNDTTVLAAQQIVSTHSKLHITQLERSLRHLKNALYKSWGKRLTLQELYDAIELAKKVLE